MRSNEEPMRVFRGQGETIEVDRCLVDRVRQHAASEAEPAIRVWQPRQQVAFGRRDAGAPGYNRARRVARDYGFVPVGRSVGGRAVAYAGTTVAFCRAEPVEDPREGLQERYDRTLEAVETALADVGVEPERGEPEGAFCPGSHSLSVDGRKVVGVAQRVTTDAALVAGLAIPRDRWAIAEVLEAVYGELDVPFDPASVGSVRAAGGDADPEALRSAIEDALVGQEDPEIERVGDAPA